MLTSNLLEDLFEYYGPRGDLYPTKLSKSFNNIVSDVVSVDWSCRDVSIFVQCLFCLSNDTREAACKPKHFVSTTRYSKSHLSEKSCFEGICIERQATAKCNKATTLRFAYSWQTRFSAI